MNLKVYLKRALPYKNYQKIWFKKFPLQRKKNEKVTHSILQPGCSNIILCHVILQFYIFLPEKKAKNYYISPVHSNESNIDDSDADPDFINKSQSPESDSTSTEGDKEVES